MAAFLQGKVLGCGSNVVDHIYNVKVVPKAGDKGFFLSPFKALEKKLIGGVTLNHLCWAALGGVQTGLLALQGQDELGEFIRTNLKKLGVGTEYIKVDSKYSTAQGHVFIQEDGERSIVMAPAATSLIDNKVVEEHFDGPIQDNASMVTTEISQVPLSGVLALLKAAKKAKVISVLDVDVSPTVALQEAELGTMEELLECVRNADVLKSDKAAAEELLSALLPGGINGLGSSLKDLTSELVRISGSRLVAITNGGEATVMANSSQKLVEVVPPTLINKVVDTTGAGGAFLGGLIVGINKCGGIPVTEKGLLELGTIGNAYGATCVQCVGGTPTNMSRRILQQYLPGTSLCIAPKTNPSEHGAGVTKMQGFTTSLATDLEALSKLSSGINLNRIGDFVDEIESASGQLYTSGVGKSGCVAQRFAGSLSSVSLPTHFVHASEWTHGDLGKARPDTDVVIFLSHSGNTGECVLAATHLIAKGVTTLAITGNKESKLAKLCAASVTYSSEGLKEPFKCLPTSSLVLQEVLCNGVLCELIQRQRIKSETFRANHPGGAIGARPRQPA